MLNCISEVCRMASGAVAPSAETLAEVLLSAITQHDNDYVSVPLDLNAARQHLGKHYLALAQQYMVLVSSPEDVQRAYDDWVHDRGGHDSGTEDEDDVKSTELMTTSNLVIQAMTNTDLTPALLSGGGCVMDDLPSRSKSELITFCEEGFCEKLAEAVIGFGLGIGRDVRRLATTNLTKV